MARILAVDDDAAFRESLVETLQGLGHEVHEAASGDEALRQAGRHRYAAIFLDHRMPGMDGLETLAALAARVPELPRWWCSRPTPAAPAPSRRCAWAPSTT